MTYSQNRSDEPICGRLLVMVVVAVAIALRAMYVGGSETVPDLPRMPATIEAEHHATHHESMVATSIDELDEITLLERTASRLPMRNDAAQ